MAVHDNHGTEEKKSLVDTIIPDGEAEKLIPEQDIEQLEQDFIDRYYVRNLRSPFVTLFRLYKRYYGKLLLSVLFFALITENLSYETGWLGDATLYEADLTTHFGNEDYCADLDGENVFRLISSGKSMADAINEYNAYLDNGGNRADKFLSYIGFDEVKSAVFNTLVIIPLNTEIEALTQANQDGSKTDQIILLNMLILDEQYHWSVVKTKYHDTYLFLRSLEGRLSEIDVNAQ